MWASVCVCAGREMYGQSNQQHIATCSRVRITSYTVYLRACHRIFGPLKYLVRPSE